MRKATIAFLLFAFLLMPGQASYALLGQKEARAKAEAAQADAEKKADDLQKVVDSLKADNANIKVNRSYFVACTVILVFLLAVAFCVGLAVGIRIRNHVTQHGRQTTGTVV